MEPLVSGWHHRDRARIQTRSPERASGRLHPNRAPMEFYPTPPEATRALLSVETFDGGIWEPACGNGAISKLMTAAGYDVVSTDIADYGFGLPRVDFLKTEIPLAKHIVTNPPYGRGSADEFITHALAMTRQTGGSVAMLLNLVSLCHPLRHELFAQNSPAAIYAFDNLICYPNGVYNARIARANNCRYCWVVWKHGHVGGTQFHWLRTADFA